MKSTSIAKELKTIIEEMDLPSIHRGRKYRWSFTTYPKSKEIDRVKSSVKFVGLYLSEEDKETIVLEMERRGFSFEFLKEGYPPATYYDTDYDNYGTSICFSSIKNTDHSRKENFIIDPSRLETIRTLLNKSKTEIMFTLEEVREHFKDAKEVRDFYSGNTFPYNPYRERIFLFYKNYWVENVREENRWVEIQLTKGNKLAKIIN